jgi:hypothetical protein
MNIRPPFTMLCFVLLSAFVVSGCRSYATPAPQDFPYELMISILEVPQGWQRKGGSFPEVEGALRTHSTFYGPVTETPWKFISHDLAVYPSEELAQEAFSRWEGDWFPAVWQPVTDGYLPVNGDDLFRYEYHDVSMSGRAVRSYRYLQQHDNFVILVLTNVDNDYLTQVMLDEILGKLDQKLQSWESE